MKKYKYGIVLGGGGSRGFAHLGVLKALEEKGIKADIIAGTSAGAIVGSVIADGKSPDEAYKLLKGKSFYDYTSMRIPRKGFFSLDGLHKNLDNILDAENIEELKIPFYACVANLNSGRAEYLQTGNLTKAVVASAAIPILFTPISINGDIYADGGLVDNLPLLPLLNKCEYLIAVSLIPVNKREKITGLKSIISRVAEMTTNHNLNNEKEGCDLIIEPPKLADYEYLSVRKSNEIYNVGYEYTKNLNLDYLL